MKVKTADLEGPALDWAVAECEKVPLWLPSEPDQIVIPEFKEPECYYSPSTKWEQGGPIIERERIRLVEPLSYWGSEGLVIPPAGADWSTYKFNPEGPHICGEGPAPLIAAMRCYVASKLGDEVEIPKELAQ